MELLNLTHSIIDNVVILFKVVPRVHYFLTKSYI